jgi:hypothetical protein
LYRSCVKSTAMWQGHSSNKGRDNSRLGQSAAGPAHSKELNLSWNQLNSLECGDLSPLWPAAAWRRDVARAFK